MGKAIELASICGLGRSVPIPLRTVSQFFESDLTKVSVEQRCQSSDGGRKSRIDMADSNLISGLFVRDDDEGLFSRDINGQLVRLDAPTEADYGKNVTLQIRWGVGYGSSGQATQGCQRKHCCRSRWADHPRYTTIYDAARQLYVEKMGDEKRFPSQFYVTSRT